MNTPEKPTEDRLIEVINELNNILKDRNKEEKTAQPPILRPICPHCKTRMIQGDNNINPPVCENPICPLNNYTNKA